ncbi:MAG TPA: FliI/YscN family ATPase [Bryobacterales bacterium]|nr:FliI/YscN family ATPase [Bryobacterales bacterium]
MEKLRNENGGPAGTVRNPPASSSLDSSISQILHSQLSRLAHFSPFRSTGVVTQVVGLLIESEGPAVSLGDFLVIETGVGAGVRCQMVGFRSGRVLSIALEELHGVELGQTIVARREAARAAVGEALLGRVLDGFGVPLDGKGPVATTDYYELYRAAPGPLERAPITEPLSTGIRAIDGLLTCGKGQRIGIFGGAGVGKSTLLGAMSRHSFAGVNVIALVGERNREVQAFLENDLGPEGLEKSVLVVATSERPAPVRVRAAFLAVAIAEFFRDLGRDVLLTMDSVTRFAMAQREIGLAAGEPPSQKGYPPSVFHLLPKIFERAGNFPTGSITGFFNVLVEGDDMNEPIADAVRGLLDGHIVLSRELAAANHYPAIDVLESISRLANTVNTPEHREWAAKMRDSLAAYRRAEDLINLGAYAAGSNPRVDAAIHGREAVEGFLCQDVAVKERPEKTIEQLRSLAARLAPKAAAPA